ncbi:MAG: molybdopterin-synthase adenylyltransferase MoeB [Chromatiales bacterium]|nr:molybdopterin-synthase adenylyltransferase MoeB [Gammaproteobacteria bacterium]MBW6475693.1 molybdopterin-synthase adenylyltransferase MoeB [Chromatiales bacterium]
MNDEQLLRYSRQLMLPQLDWAGQQRLLASHALIVGMGGLGSPVAMYLAAAGVGELTLVDDDVVDISNLQRQILHGVADMGRPKVESAASTLRRQNPDVRLNLLQTRLEGEDLLAQVRAVDVVIDASDNFSTRFALNDACVQAKTPLVSGAAIRFEGQLSVFDPRRDDSPCYRCLYRDEGESAQTCSENGILAPVVGVIGALQATETLKLLAGIGEPLVGRLLIWDALGMEWRQMRLRKDPDCPVCRSRA